jgi:D-xylose transport system permease protein
VNRSVNPRVEISGIPYVLPLILILLIVMTVVLKRTSYGRHIYAVGGNAEAARRAGISVDRIRVTVFIACSSLAALSGIIAASYAGKVSAASGAGNVLLYAVGAAVIGGTSLFGGKGRALDAVIGGVVVATIANGLGLLNQSSYINFLVTGGVLLLAASVDAISRRRRSSTGLS